MQYPIRVYSQSLPKTPIEAKHVAISYFEMPGARFPNQTRSGSAARAAAIAPPGQRTPDQAKVASSRASHKFHSVHAGLIATIKCIRDISHLLPIPRMDMMSLAFVLDTFAYLSHVYAVPRICTLYAGRPLACV